MNTSNEAGFDYVQSIPKSDFTLQDEIMSRYRFVDLGRIQSYNEDGSVNILSPYFLEGHPVTYRNVEVLYIGTKAGCISYNAEGSLCLLLKPYTCIPDTTSMEILAEAGKFSNKGMKAIPISNGRETSLKTLFDGFGNFKLSGNGVSVEIKQDTVTLSAGDVSYTFNNEGDISKCLCAGQLFIEHNHDGTSRVLRYDNNGKAQYMLKVEASGQYTVKRNATKAFEDSDYDDLDAFEDWMWVETYNTDGSVSKILQQDSSTPLYTHGVASSGSVTDTFASGKTYTLNVGDDVSITVDDKSVSITIGSDISISADSTSKGLNIQTSGPISLTTTGNTGTIDIEANKDLTIKTTGSDSSITVEPAKDLDINVESGDVTVKATNITAKCTKFTVADSLTGETKALEVTP